MFALCSAPNRKRYPFAFDGRLCCRWHLAVAEQTEWQRYHGVFSWCYASWDHVLCWCRVQIDVHACLAGECVLKGHLGGGGFVPFPESIAVDVAAGFGISCDGTRASYSVDGFLTWTPLSPDDPIVTVGYVSNVTNGASLAAAVATSGTLYVSLDHGGTWRSYAAAFPVSPSTFATPPVLVEITSTPLVLSPSSSDDTWFVVVSTLDGPIRLLWRASDDIVRVEAEN